MGWPVGEVMIDPPKELWQLGEDEARCMSGLAARSWWQGLKFLGSAKKHKSRSTAWPSSADPRYPLGAAAEECSTAFINRNAPNVTQLLAVSTVDVLRRTARTQDGLCFSVKWPNDVIVNDMKIAGILARAEASAGSRLDRIIVGIGVNLNAPQADLDLIERPLFPATSLRAISGSESVYDVSAFRQELAASFAAALRKFFIEGFAGILEQLNALDVYLNRRICFQVNQHTTFDATYLGINESGHVTLRLDDGNVKVFPSGEVLLQTPGEVRQQREPDKPAEEVRKKGEPRGREL